MEKLHYRVNNDQQEDDVENAIFVILETAWEKIKYRIEHADGLLNEIENYGQFIFDHNKLIGSIDLMMGFALGEKLITIGELKDIENLKDKYKREVIKRIKQIALLVKYKEKCQLDGKTMICDINEAMQYAQNGTNYR